MVDMRTAAGTGGTAERAMTSEQTITVTVTDVDEPPEAPEAPTVMAASLTSLAVTWTAPANTGPAITGYDVRYKATGGAFTNWNHDSANTTTTITDLTPNTRYYVQVRARNHEGPLDAFLFGLATAAVAGLEGSGSVFKELLLPAVEYRRLQRQLVAEL